MDGTSIMVAFSALDAARKAALVALEVRDFNKTAAELSKINEALLQAQNALLAQNAVLFQLQSEKFETAEKLRKLEETLSEKARYSLVEITQGSFAYRVNVAPQQGGASEPSGTEPVHYVCQPCFDKGVKSVLQSAGHLLTCTICKSSFKTGLPLPKPIKVGF